MRFFATSVRGVSALRSLLEASYHRLCRSNLLSPLTIESLLASALAFLGLWLPLVGYSDVFQVSEGREGVVVKQIIFAREYILPLRHDALIPSKPILFHWVSAFFAWIFGDYNEALLRLPSAMGAAGIVGLLFFLVCRTTSRTAAVFAALSLATGYGFNRLAMDGRVDMLFCFFVIAAIVIWLVHVFPSSSTDKDDRLQMNQTISGLTYAGIAVCCGLAILSKGPLGLLLPGLIIVAISIFLRGWRSLGDLLRWQWIIAPIIAAPWYIAAGLAGGKSSGENFVNRQLVFENVQRFFGGIGISEKPPWFYVAHVFSQGAPWTFILLAVICYVAYQRFVASKKQADTVKKPLCLNTSEHRLAKSAWIWIAVVFLFLSISSGKRRAYLLPILPPISIVTGIYLKLIWEEGVGFIGRKWIKRFNLFLLIVWGCLLLTPPIIYLFCIMTLGEASLLGQGLKRLPEAVSEGGIALALYWTIGTLVGAITLFRARSLFSLRWSIASFIACLIFIQTVILSTGLAVKGKTHGYKQFAMQAAPLVQEQSPVFMIKETRDESFDGFFFYFRRSVKLRSLAQVPKEPGFYFARKSWISQQTPEWTASLNLLLEGGRAVDSEEEKLVLFRVS